MEENNNQNAVTDLNSSNVSDSGKFTLICDQCGSTNVVMKGDNFGFCKNCGTQFRVQDKITNNFTSNYNTIYNVNQKQTSTEVENGINKNYQYVVGHDYKDKKQIIKDAVVKICASDSSEFNSKVKLNENFFSNAIVEVKEGYMEFMKTNGKYSGSYSCSLGYYRTQQTVDIHRNGIVTGLITNSATTKVYETTSYVDWKPFNVNFQDKSTTSNIFTLSNPTTLSDYVLEKALNSNIFVVSNSRNYYEYAKYSGINFNPTQLSDDEILRKTKDHIDISKFVNLPTYDEIDGINKDIRCDKADSVFIYVIPYTEIIFKEGSNKISVINVGNQKDLNFINKTGCSYNPSNTNIYYSGTANQYDKIIRPLNIISFIINLIFFMVSIVKIGLEEYEIFPITLIVIIGFRILVPIIKYILTKALQNYYNKLIESIKFFISKNQLPEFNDSDKISIQNKIKTDKKEMKNTRLDKFCTSFAVFSIIFICIIYFAKINH